MPFDVKIILPSSLKSSYLKSEFIAEGQTYTTNKYSSIKDTVNKCTEYEINLENKIEYLILENQRISKMQNEINKVFNEIIKNLM